MILLWTEQTPIENKLRATAIHYMPFDEVHGLHKTREELEKEGAIFVESIPESTEDKPSDIFVNKTTLEVTREYIDVPEPFNPEKEIESLKVINASLEESNLQTNIDLGNLLIQNALDKATITELNDMLGNLLLEVATLKGGAA